MQRGVNAAAQKRRCSFFGCGNIHVLQPLLVLLNSAVESQNFLKYESMQWIFVNFSDMSIILCYG